MFSITKLSEQQKIPAVASKIAQADFLHDNVQQVIETLNE